MAECLEKPCEPGVMLKPPLESGGRYLLIGVLLAAILASVSLVAVLAGRPASAALPSPTLGRTQAAISYSGDDAYDLAAGSRPALFVRPDAISYSGDDLYDPAAGGNPARAARSAPTSHSGDDAYDLAAGSLPALFVRPAGASYSGDDAYDPAAGGNPL